jgi:hypothetical protein
MHSLPAPTTQLTTYIPSDLDTKQDLQAPQAMYIVELIYMLFCILYILI